MPGASCAQVSGAASVLCGFFSVPFLISLSVVNGAVSAMSLPASAAITPQTVPRDLLAPSNALLRLLVNGDRIAGAGVAGVAVAAVGSGWALAVNALLFFAAALAYHAVRLPRAERAPGSRPIADLIAGWHEFRSHPWVWAVVAQFAVVNAAGFGALTVIGPALTLGWWPSLAPALIAMLVVVATGLALCSREIRQLTNRQAAPVAPTGS